jgi:predicted MPP superfamily phosphohydrolase
VPFTNLPAAFDGFTILQISDLHVELSEAAVRNMIDLVGDLRYDVCVLTGDYRSHTHGPFDRSLDAVELLRAKLAGPVYGVLGNHDSIRMTPRLEAIGVRMLFNECQRIVREDQAIYLAGVDDPHFYRADNIGKAAADIPPDAL